MKTLRNLIVTAAIGATVSALFLWVVGKVFGNVNVTF